MHYKNFFSAAALVTLLSLSNSAFSDTAGLEEDDTSYYVRLQYNGEFLPFKTKIDGVTGAKKGEPSADTTDMYKASFFGGGAAFGYKMDDIRVDIEGLYSQLSKDTLETAPTPDFADKLTVIAGLVNVNYDIALLEDMPVVPYVSVGVGGAYISSPLKAPVVNTAANGFGVAYQVKAGVSYAVTPEINLYAGARYFGSYGAKFDKSADAADKGAIKVLYSVVGAEAGVAFNF